MKNTQDSNQQESEDSDLQLDAEQFKQLFQKLKSNKDKLSSARQSNGQIEIKSFENSIQQENSNSKERTQIRSLKSRNPHTQRERSRQKNLKQNIRWHIYEDVKSVDYSDTIPQKLKKLPIFKKKDEILQKIIQNQIVLVTGDTGCGKSTQVPRLIYQYLKIIKSTDKIICVQPRRLAVTSLKSAVQSQLPENQRVVGYQIGQKAQFGPYSRIVFMTNGIFLQRIIHDTQFLNEYPFIILDQVHERDIDTDFILTTLKRVIRKFPKVRIVLMSATIDNELFRYYFASDHIDNFMNAQNFYKQIIEFEEYNKANQEEGSNPKHDSDEQQQQKNKIYDNVALKFLESKFPCPAININQAWHFKRTYYYIDTMHKFIEKQYLKKWGAIIWSHKHPNMHKQLFESAWIILSQIKHNTQKKYDLSGEAVLIFLPGLNQIESLTEELLKLFGGYDKFSQFFEIIHVHSTTMNQQVEQRLNRPNPKQIKVIIATNIAQSSITIKGIKYIIDFCLTKQNRYDMKSKMENLELVWSSKASCKQRAGRTGRVCDGYIFRLVEEKFYQMFNHYSEPEIKRSSLDKVILRIKLMHQKDKQQLFRDPAEVLGTCIQPPKLQSIVTAMNSLKFCGGLEQSKDQYMITELGRLYVDIPIDIAYTKLLVTSILFGTYYDILILVSILSQSKNPIPRRQIEENYLQYFNEMNNYEYCDFLALINLYKSEEEFRKQIRQKNHWSQRESNNRQFMRNQHKKNNRLNFSIYSQTKNTIEDINRRLKRKKQFDVDRLQSYLGGLNGQDYFKYSQKCKQEKIPRQKYQDYLMRFKLTIAFGFVDKLIKIQPPLYQEKQMKRIDMMKKYNIPNQNTIVLLNSSVITKPFNSSIQANQRFIRHWKEVFKKSLDINIRDITLGSGLNYLHCEQEKDLNKLLFIKYMDSNSRRKGCAIQKNENSKRNPNKYASSQQRPYDQRGQSKRSQNYQCTSSILTVKQIMECLGDLDHMQQGRPQTLFQQNRLTIDYHSVNRVCNLNENVTSKYLLTNSFMLQNSNSMSSRYTSVLSIFSLETNKIPNSILHVLINLIFYPFVRLKTDEKNTKYERLCLKHKYSIQILHNLTSEEIEKANEIRLFIKLFLEFKLEMCEQSCMQFCSLVKSFVLRKRKQTIQEKQDQIWQMEFIKQIKEGKVKQIDQLNQFSNQINSKNGHQEEATLMHEKQKQKVQQQKNISQVFEKDINSIVEQNIGVAGKKLKEDQHVLTFNQIRQKLKNNKKSFQIKNFMNPIELPAISCEDSYFFKMPNQSAQLFQKRISIYLNWKYNKLKQVQQLARYAQDNDTYLCCGYKKSQQSLQYCAAPISKMKRIGALNEQQNFRDLFEPITSNLKESFQEDTEIDDFLFGQNLQDQYTKISCINGHQIGVKLKNDAKIKIVVIAPLAIKYPNYPERQSIREAQFFNLDIKDWQKQEKAALIKKQKRLLSTSCYLCAVKISTFKQLKAHFQDSSHKYRVEGFKKSIQLTKLQIQNNCKLQEEIIEIQLQGQKQQSNLVKSIQNYTAQQNAQNAKINAKEMEIEY